MVIVKRNRNQSHVRRSLYLWLKYHQAKHLTSRFTKFGGKKIVKMSGQDESFPNEEERVGRLRFASYLCHSIPIEYFEIVVQYLDSKLKVHTSLVCESRWPGPPAKRPDPFAMNDIDVAFVTTSSFLKYIDEKSEFVEMLPVGSVHFHSKAQEEPGYFADVIMHVDNSHFVKEFDQLRGCRWAYNTADSLSGTIAVLHSLKQLGVNASFFGHILQSGSHLNSIEMVRNKQAEAASVDANCLAIYFDKYPEAKEEIKTVTSIGPLPPYPILINSRLSDALKEKMASALRTMHQDKDWGPKLNKFHVRRFKSCSPSVYEKERAMIQDLDGMNLNHTYY